MNTIATGFGNANTEMRGRGSGLPCTRLCRRFAAAAAGSALLLAANGIQATPTVGFGATNVLGRYMARDFIPALPGAAGYRSNFSGCCVDPASGQIIAVMRGTNLSDYAVQFYTPDGRLSRFVALTGFDDLEGICVYDPASNLYAVVEEALNDITILDLGGTVTNLSKADGRTIHMGLGGLLNAGIEGITWDAARRCFYAVKEYQPERIYRVTEGATNTVTEELFSAGMISNLCADLSDVFYDAASDHLLVLSHESHVLVECTLEGIVLGTLPLPSLTQPEGVVLSPARDELYVIGEPNQYGRFAAHWQLLPEGDTGTLPLQLSAPAEPGVTASVTVSTGAGSAVNPVYVPADAVAWFTNGLSAAVAVRVAPDDTLNPPRDFRMVLADPAGAELGDDTVAVWRVTDPGRFTCTLDTLPGAGAAFRVTVAARDTNGVVLTGFTGPVSLRLWGDTSVSQTMLESPVTQPATVAQRSTRGLRFTPTNDIVVTHLRYVFGTRIGLWTDDGTLLASASGPLVNGTWQEVALTNPVALTAGSTYRVAASRAAELQQYYTLPLGMPATFANGTILSGCLTNAANAFPDALATNAFAVDITYTGPGRGIMDLAPASSGSFEAGIWSGWLTVTGVVRNAEIEVFDADGHTGRSEVFDIPVRPAVTLQLPAAVTESDGTLAGAGRVAIAPQDAAQEVMFFCDNTNAITLPATLIVPPAATSVVFDVTVVDNTVFHDTRTVSVYATAAGHTAGTAGIRVWDDDLPGGLMLFLAAHGR
jgi:uncharacterized protein YjiK